MRSTIPFVLNCLLISSISTHAQSITQSTFTSAGRLLTDQGVSLNFTVSELSIQNLKNPAVGINTGLFGKEEEVNLGTLPVRLIDFRLVAGTTSVDLHWTVGQEVNIAYYEVFKSTNGVDFISIGKLSATGATSTEKQYQLTDNQFSAKSFYKLKIADVGGQFRFSNTLLALQGASANLVSVYPNPVADVANVTITATGTKAYVFTIVNAAGVPVWSKAYTLSAGQNAVSISTGSLPAGYYFLSVSSENECITKPIIKR